VSIEIPFLSDGVEFPNPKEAIEEGLLAWGGDLSVERLLSAYQKGIFPWYSKNDPIMWWSPDPRLILYPKELKVSKSLKKTINKEIFNIKFDYNFETVIDECSSVYRKDQLGTWLVDDMKKAYTKLHKLGYAHSIEAYDSNNHLVGGLYGVSLGKAFFGESMFARESNASKVAFYHLVQRLKEWEFDFIDCQVPTDHLISLGAIEVDRDYFLDMLQESIQKESHIYNWE
jgi:leucyl/phenylalanyl-tRNA--protein transferase